MRSFFRALRELVALGDRWISQRVNQIYAVVCDHFGLLFALTLYLLMCALTALTAH